MGLPPLPLPPNYFLQPPLQPHDVDKYFRLAEVTTRDVIAAAQLDGGVVQWTPAGVVERPTMTNRVGVPPGRGACTIYKGSNPTAPPGVISYMATMELEATLAEITTLFAASTQEELHQFRRTLAQDAHEIHLLYALATPTPDFPNRLVAIRYYLMKSAVPALSRPRDYCCLESNLDFDINGKRGFARSMRSIDLACVPTFEESFNIVRGYQHGGGFVFVETDAPGVLSAVQLQQVDLKGKLPTWLIDLRIKLWCRGFHAIAQLVSESRMDEQEFLLDHEVVSKSSRRHCVVCLTKFRLVFKPPARCRKCGEVMCHKCAPLWSVRTKGGQVRRIRVCQLCSRNSHPLQSQSSSQEAVEMVMLGPEDVEDKDGGGSDELTWRQRRTHDRAVVVG
ncbi:hypothetical protein H310_03686 [Aphanomyces invadans]|uniref:FYVE-type domain-containing protein n=1 Tax=Aphanomyces invadans TaxID=157072 RepID=A0A024UJQ1_9STRA|nr:hypothetical protein H310_03686 [Aphanomyces invadans]ETW06092.1 hypothetical protein H310_03686 [Aphanomyces invadans]|eukprot:XP_008865869.1 hypothetical protein H310_03686 [Aphanomyces invadans]